MSKDTVFLAGGSGVVGLPLIKLLRADGWRVVASTQSPSKFDILREAGAEPVVMDAFDGASVAQAVSSAKPQIIIHQLTSLPDGLAPALMAAARERNAQIRDLGTRHLVAAAKAAGISRFIAQSIAFAYAAGPEPHMESDALDPAAWGVKRLEEQSLSGPFTGLVLRYGHFYGPGTGFASAERPASLHIDEAARAAALAAKTGAAGIYNIAEVGGPVDVTKAATMLRFVAATRSIGDAY